MEWEARVPLLGIYNLPSASHTMPRTRKILKAAKQCILGYARKSTDTEDKQVHSLDDQEKFIRDHYKSLSIEEQKHPLRILRESHSAYRAGRPIFGDMMRMIDRGEVYGVIAIHPNRISRNHEDSGTFVQRLVDGHISFLDATHG